MLLQFGSKPVVVASSAEAAREIMKNHDLVFASRPRLSFSDRFFYGGGRDVAFASYGDSWRQGRGICVVQMFSTKRVQSFRPIQEEETSLMIEKIKRSSPSVVNLSELFMALTNDVVCRAALGRTYGSDEREKDFNQILKKIVEILKSYNVGDFVPWLGWINHVNGVEAQVEKIFKMMDEFMEGVLREYRDKKSSDDAVMNFADVASFFWYQRRNHKKN